MIQGPSKLLGFEIPKGPKGSPYEVPDPPKEVPGHLA